MASLSAAHIDDIFRRLGSPGHFTLRQLVCLAVGAFPCAFQLLSNVFIGRIVPYKCAAPPNGTAVAPGYADRTDINVEYDECEIVVRSNSSVLERMECVYGMEYSHPRDSSVISEFDLVCSKLALLHLSQTCVIAGQGLGGFVATIMADRFGRRPVTVGANFGLLLCGLAIAFAPNYVVFVCFKFLAGACQQAYLSSSMTILLEMLTAKNRRWSTAIEGIKWSMGVLSLTLVAYLLRHQSWRSLQLVLSLASLPAFFQLWLGRKRTLIVLCLMLSLGLTSSGALRTLEGSYAVSVLALACSLVAVFGASGGFRIVLGFTLELFPTNVRNQAFGICSCIGRAGGMVAPFMSLLGQYVAWAPGIIIGCLSLIVTFLLRFVPETNDRQLPQTLEELHDWSKTERKSNVNVIVNFNDNHVNEKLNGVSSH